MKRHDAPQTVGEAIENGWQYLAPTCLICRRSGRTYFNRHGESERLASLIRRFKCLDCGRRTETIVMIGVETLIDAQPRERQIFAEGDSVIPAGRF